MKKSITTAMQSPINILSDQVKQDDALQLRLEYDGPATFDLNMQEKKIQATGPALLFNGKRFKLKQFHFHQPSEHQIDGQLSDTEVHFVHEADDGMRVVIGVMMTQGESGNDQYQKVFKYLVEMPDASLSVDIRALIPQLLDCFHYHGSLSTPPYTEGVVWLVCHEQMVLSLQQIDDLKKSGWAGSRRETQELNGRLVCDLILNK